MKKTFILLTTYCLSIISVFAIKEFFEYDPIEAWASLEAYKQWAIDTKNKINIETEKDKLNKIQEIEKKASEALYSTKPITEEQTQKPNQADITRARNKNNVLLEKVAWDKDDGANLIFSDIKEKKEIVDDYIKIIKEISSYTKDPKKLQRGLDDILKQN